MQRPETCCNSGALLATPTGFESVFLDDPEEEVVAVDGPISLEMARAGRAR